MTGFCFHRRTRLVRFVWPWSIGLFITCPHCGATIEVRP